MARFFFLCSRSQMSWQDGDLTLLRVLKEVGLIKQADLHSLIQPRWPQFNGHNTRMEQCNVMIGCGWVSRYRRRAGRAVVDWSVLATVEPPVVPSLGRDVLAAVHANSFLFLIEPRKPFRYLKASGGVYFPNPSDFWGMNQVGSLLASFVIAVSSCLLSFFFRQKFFRFG